MPRRKPSRGNAMGLMAGFELRQTDRARPSASTAALDPNFVARCKASLADPRPSLSAADVRAELRAHHEARRKRDA